MLLGVDVGGTFTDAVLALDGRLITAKAPTTPADQSEGVLAAIEAALEKAGADADEIREFSHGMTVATNALLEGNGARTAFVATEGFTDIVALGRQSRPELYRLCAGRPAPLTPPEGRFGAPERMTPDGALRELHQADAQELAQALAGYQPEAVAVALLHAYRHPEHELAVAEALRRELPDVHVSLSRTRWWARFASSSAPARPRSTPPSRRCWAATCAGWWRAASRPGSPSRRSCNPTAA